MAHVVPFEQWCNACYQQHKGLRTANGREVVSTTLMHDFSVLGISMPRKGCAKAGRSALPRQVATHSSVFASIETSRPDLSSKNIGSIKAVVTKRSRGVKDVVEGEEVVDALLEAVDSMVAGLQGA
jgi:hypothetical protein